MTASIAGWILTYGFHSTVLCVLALLVTRLRRIDAASRCVILRCALLFPFVSASLASTDLNRSAPIRITTPVRRLLPPEVAQSRVNVEVRSLRGSAPRRVVTVNDDVSDVASRVLVLFAAVGAIGGLLLFHRRNSSALRVVAGGTPLMPGHAAAEARGIDVRSSHLLEIPVALRNKRILVPTVFGEMSNAEQESVLLHEIAHVERSDPAWLDAARLVSALTWWQPLNRLACDSLERETEIAADKHAVAIGAQPRALVSALARFAALLNTRCTSVGAALVRGDSPLVTRATLLLDRRIAQGFSRRVLYAVLGLICVVIISLPAATTLAAVPSAHDGDGFRAGTMVEEADIRIIDRGGNPSR